MRKQLEDWFRNFEHRMEVQVPTLVAEAATEFFQDRFRTQEWDKQPWQALNPKYAKNKSRGKARILTQTGNLRASIKPTVVTARRVVISAGSAAVPYAKAHNEGLRIKGIAQVRPYTNSNFMGTGKRVQIKKHSRRYNITMPRRQFMGHSRFLNQGIIGNLTKAFNQ